MNQLLVDGFLGHLVVVEKADVLLVLAWNSALAEDDEEMILVGVFPRDDLASRLEFPLLDERVVFAGRLEGAIGVDEGVFDELIVKLVAQDLVDGTPDTVLQAELITIRPDRHALPRGFEFTIA
jgi:hypothetical protein